MKVKVLLKKGAVLPHIIKKGDWIDLYSAETVSLKAPQASKSYTKNKELLRDVTFDFHLIDLGIAMKLPKGFEAIIVPRSSLYIKKGIIQANHCGIVDNSYCGNNDVWKFPAIAFTHTTINRGDKICQFKIQLSQKATMWQKLKWLFSSSISILPVTTLKDQSRGGFGSTGNK